MCSACLSLDGSDCQLLADSTSFSIQVPNAYSINTAVLPLSKSGTGLSPGSGRAGPTISPQEGRMGETTDPKSRHEPLELHDFAAVPFAGRADALLERHL